MGGTDSETAVHTEVLSESYSQEHISERVTHQRPRLELGSRRNLVLSLQEPWRQDSHTGERKAKVSHMDVLHTSDP